MSFEGSLVRQPVWSDESGEGVISTAIAVLIMAFLGVALWAVFSGVLTQAEDKIEQQVNEIGND